MDDRALAELRRLADQDRELAAQAELLDGLDALVAKVRERAEAIDGFFGTYPAEEARLRDAVAATRAELERRRSELTDAEATLARAQDEESRDRAHHAVERAHDHVRVAVAGLDRAKEAAADHERQATALPDELPRLESEAQEVRRRFPDLPAPPSGPRELVEWASRAHADIFVGAGHIATQRDRVIREANELATMLLGEPTYGSTVEQALTRVVAIRSRG